MLHWKLTLAYDGTPYNGWQIQPNLPTVQGTLARAIHHITGETTLPQGSGRTDTGVHALAQVATVTLTNPIPGPNLHRALNRILPPSIRVLSVDEVPPDFHARHSARRKTYEYRILPGNRICSPMLAPYVWAFQRPLDLATLQQAATYVIGTHDFTSFAATDPDVTNRDGVLVMPNRPFVSTGAKSSEAENPGSITFLKGRDFRSAVKLTTATRLQPLTECFTQPEPPPIPTTNTRTIYHSAWHQQQDLYVYRVTGSGFLHRMVRNLVGTFVQTATGHIPVDAIPQALAARNRSAAGFTAPARGLFLVEVEY
jgi:tRNA pseudouridine38-40 synthase